MTIHQEHSEPERRQEMGEGVGHPATTSPMGAGYDSPADNTTRVEETAPEPADDHPRSTAAADSRAERLGLLNDPAYLRNEWQLVQGTFVDDPQKAVHEASALVDRTLREIQENVSRVHISDSTSTEDLRMSFQRYREFFQRLLSA
ncbi:MAG: hypothetical protein ACRDRA_00390 [Pseudonocardiaceae bacterium]